MINPEYLIDCGDWLDEGGCCQVYPIKNQNNIVFKEFKNQKKAQETYNNQKLLAKFDMAPKLYSKVCKLKFAKHGEISFVDPSNWGYISELATIHDASTKISMDDIQNLVNDIDNKTGLKFWDCHWYNVGLVKRGKKKKVVCIDTGKESFEINSNAWANPNPGPKCSYCEKYECNCSS